MNIRHAFPGWLAAILLLSGAGCQKSGSDVSLTSSSVTPPSADTVVRVHWLGQTRMGIDAGAYYFARVWGLPETTKVQAQTFYKLSTVPWRLLQGEDGATNATSALVRPLLYDISREECYLEVRQATDQPEQFAFAIRLNDDRAGVWETNLATVLHSLTGSWLVASEGKHSSWTLKQQRAPNLIELTRVGEWIIVGAAQENNALLSQIVERIQQDHAPFITHGTNYWLQADVDLQRLAGVLPPPLNSSSNLPKISLAITGDGGNVLTHAELTFPEPLQLDLEPWNIPTNRIIEPIVSFTAIRGIKPWLASWKTWNNLQIGPPPNQLCSWAPDGIPLQIILAAPLVDVSNQVWNVTDVLLREGNPWLAANGVGKFENLEGANGVFWSGLPPLAPFIKSTLKGDVVLCGLLPNAGAGTNTQSNLYYRPSLADTLQDMVIRTNLVYYDWELTAPRVESSLFISQVFRTALRHPQLPLETISVDWLKNVKARLGDSWTYVARTAPNQLSFDRQSTMGFTGAELQLLADWLESPQFPFGLHTFLAPPDQ